MTRDTSDRTGKTVTLKDVARAAGVHSSTVSRVMSPLTRHMIGSDVVQRVMEAAQTLGYRPNQAAATLRTRRSNIIGVVIPDITNPVFPPILRGLEQALRAEGYAALVADAEDDEQQRFIIEQMLARQADGLVLATTTRRDPIIDLCLERGLPVVSVNRSEDTDRVSCVVNDEMAGMRLAVEHLVGLGHRRIAHIAGPQHLSTGHQRKIGFEEAVAAQGLAKVDCCIVDGSAYSREAGQQACARILKSYRATSAIVAGNDLVALGCYDAIKAAGLSCPKDVSVIGHNDMPLVDMVAPPLTTIRIRHHELGVQAARLLLLQIQRKDSAPMDIRLKPSLVVRDSTGAAPRRAR